LFLTLPAARAQERQKPPERSLYEDLQLFSQVLNQLRLNHPDSLDPHTLVMAAIRGMVAAADPHSWVVPAMHMDPEKERALEEGRLASFPVRFEVHDGMPLVVSVDPGTDAARLGIFPGDVLLEVEGNPPEVGSTSELALLLAGPRDEEVLLTLERWTLDGNRRTYSRLVRREEGNDEAFVPRGSFLGERVGYLQVPTFDHPRVADRIRDRLGDLEDRGMEALILDLRDNAGGRVDQAADIAGEFLPKGTLVYTSQGRRPEAADTVRVERSFWRGDRAYPLVVLVNEGTASAAEMVAAALQDHDRAFLVGRSTFGKALIMSPFLMSDGSVLMMAIGQLRTPCGRVIQRPYRSLSPAYYRILAGTPPDTASLPRCTSAGGRTLYGGWGIQPDRLLTPRPPPEPWITNAADLDLFERWGSAFISERRVSLTSVEALLEDESIQAEMLRSFRSVAEAANLTLGEEATDAALLPFLLVEAAYLGWDASQGVSLSARMDSEVAAGLDAIPRARELVARGAFRSNPW
jgi:carboxyl-terminal processing protease